MPEENSESDVNVPRLKEMAIRGEEYREEFEIEYFGESGTLHLGSLADEYYIPMVGTLQDKFDLDIDEAQEQIEEAKEEGDDDNIDPAGFDEEFVDLMKRAAYYGIDRTEGIATGMTKEDLKAVLGMYEEEEKNIGLRGGKTLEIAYKVLNITSDAESAEKFRRDGGGS